MSGEYRYIPLEDDEAMVFANWLRINNIPHTHIANEIGGSTKATKLRAIKAKKMGQTAGVWDYEIFIPITNIDGEIDAYQEARIELKRAKGSKISREQKAWGEIYSMAGIPCAICKGARSAIDFVQELIREIEGTE